MSSGPRSSIPWWPGEVSNAREVACRVSRASVKTIGKVVGGVTKGRASVPAAGALAPAAPGGAELATGLTFAVELVPGALGLVAALGPVAALGAVAALARGKLVPPLLPLQPEAEPRAKAASARSPT